MEVQVLCLGERRGVQEPRRSVTPALRPRRGLAFETERSSGSAAWPRPRGSCVPRHGRPCERTSGGAHQALQGLPVSTEHKGLSELLWECTGRLRLPPLWVPCLHGVR